MALSFFSHIQRWLNQKKLDFHNKKKTEDMLKLDWMNEPGARWDKRWEIDVWSPQKGMGVNSFLQAMGITTDKKGTGFNPRAIEKMLDKWIKKVAGVKTEDTTAISMALQEMQKNCSLLSLVCEHPEEYAVSIGIQYGDSFQDTETFSAYL